MGGSNSKPADNINTNQSTPSNDIGRSNNVVETPVPNNSTTTWWDQFKQKSEIKTGGGKKRKSKNQKQTRKTRKNKK
jgi:hypothetical protein